MQLARWFGGTLNILASDPQCGPISTWTRWQLRFKITWKVGKSPRYSPITKNERAFPRISTQSYVHCSQI
eukprot:scaffold692_cov118-Cylindrotheca_fusiformis.AAC.6